MERLFFLVSGEHPTLPFSEITSILKAEGYKYKVLKKLKQVLCLEVNKNAVNSVIARAALTRVCSKELFNCSAKLPQIVDALRRTSLNTVIEKGGSFMVRVRRVGAASTDVISMDLERKLGEIILEKVKETKVNLKTPKYVFFGVLTENRFVFGLKLGEILAKPFSERRPRKRPFFQPSAMPAKLARCMVNLARPKRGSFLFDPFCGTGSFLIEAGLIGCRVTGSDVKKHMVKGSLRNLKHFGIIPEAMIIADAKHSPLGKADCIVTDPPYGRTASTLGKNTEQIIKEALPEFKNILRNKGYVCIAAPKSVAIGKIAAKVGFTHVESHYVYVHRSLTREIAVLVKN